MTVMCKHIHDISQVNSGLFSKKTPLLKQQSLLHPATTPRDLLLIGSSNVNKYGVVRRRCAAGTKKNVQEKDSEKEIVEWVSRFTSQLQCALAR